MSNKVSVSNSTAMPIYVGSIMIPAGETRVFNEDEVPAHLRPPAEAPVVEPPAADETEGNAGGEGGEGGAGGEGGVGGDDVDVKALAAAKVADILPQLGALSGPHLYALQQIELARGAAARKTVLEAITAESLKRAGAGA